MASTESCESMDSLASPVHPSGAVDEMHPASRPSGVLTSFVRPNRPPADSSCVCRRYAHRLNHRHTDSQSGAGRPPALYFNKLPGRPLPNLQDNAGLCTASSRKIHARVIRTSQFRPYIAAAAISHTIRYLGIDTPGSGKNGLSIR